MKRTVLALTAVTVLSVALIWLAASRLTSANAQGDVQLWSSSAEAPDDTGPVQYSPPDDPTANALRQETAAPEELISWRVTGSALKPRENDVSYTVDGNGSCTYVTAGDAQTVWNIPVQLPQGTLVDTLRIYYFDTSDSNTTAWFTVYDLYGDLVQEWSVSSNTVSGNSFNDSAQINHVVDYSVYSYMVNWRPIVTGSTIQLCGFRIFHDPPFYSVGFLPIVR